MATAFCSYSSSRVTRSVTSRITPYMPYPPMTRPNNSGCCVRETSTTEPSASSRRKRCTTSTTCMTSTSRPCALALSVPPTVKMLEDCITFRASRCGASARCTSSQVAPLSTVMAGVIVSMASTRLQLLDILRGGDRRDSRRRDPGDVGGEQWILAAKQIAVGNDERAGVQHDGQKQGRAERQPRPGAAAHGYTFPPCAAHCCRRCSTLFAKSCCRLVNVADSSSL